MSRGKSVIWQFFTLAENTKFAKCKKCEHAVSRGGKTAKSYNTTNLVAHLKKNHSEEYQQFMKSIEDAVEGNTRNDQPKRGCRQLSLHESTENARRWDINDSRAQNIHTRIGEMIALDYQPFSVVEDVGFCRLLHAIEPKYNIPSRKYFTETVVPEIHDRIKKAVAKEIAAVRNMSFTTDIWSTAVNMHSLLSLTAHWVTESFERKSAVLHAKPFDGSHTGESIAETFDDMFRSWDINKQDQVHLVVRDNASNMVKAMSVALLPDLGCFAHTLQLVVNDGTLSQRAVTDMCATARKIVGHFRRSCLAYDHLRSIQANLGLAQHRLVQDEPTRWNSTLHMLQRILEQKMALAAYATEHPIPQLTQNQLNLANKVVQVLVPIDEITKSVSLDSAAVSVIIPFVRILSRTLDQNEEDSGVRTMKADMKASLAKRYVDVEKNDKLTIATILDPRFKDKFFTEQCVKDEVKALVHRQLEDVTRVDQPSQLVENSRELEPPTKRPCVWTTYSALLEEAGVHVSDPDNSEFGSTEFDLYLAEPVIQLGKENPYTWWSKNNKRFPQLAKIAQKYLSAPPSSVASERLFSGAGNVYDDKRNKLLPEKAEMLLFIKNNFKMCTG